MTTEIRTMVRDFRYKSNGALRVDGKSEDEWIESDISAEEAIDDKCLETSGE